jgi:hypothetical protein
MARKRNDTKVTTKIGYFSGDVHAGSFPNVDIIAFRRTHGSHPRELLKEISGTPPDRAFPHRKGPG